MRANYWLESIGKSIKIKDLDKLSTKGFDLD